MNQFIKLLLNIFFLKSITNLHNFKRKHLFLLIIFSLLFVIIYDTNLNIFEL
jgi:hypothetical protein